MHSRVGPVQALTTCAAHNCTTPVSSAAAAPHVERLSSAMDPSVFGARYTTSSVATLRTGPQASQRCQPCSARIVTARHEKLRSFMARAGVDSESVGDDGEDRIDIDALAQQLSQEAERLRRAESGKAASSSSQPPPAALGDDPIFGIEAVRRQEAFLAVTQGGFVANEFEILQQLGRLSWVTEGAKEDPLQVTATTTEQVQAVVAFAARYFSGGPFQDPEFLPAARPVGCNELLISAALSGLPEMKWQAAAASLSASPPVVPILGFFMARHSDTGVLLSQEDMQAVGSQEALWLVYKWEALQPLSFYPDAEQQQQQQRRPGFSFFGADNDMDALTARCRMLRRIAHGVVAAVAFCHGRAVSHRSLGSGSFLLSTFDDRRADALIVKLTNFGFAQQMAENGVSLQAGLPSWQKDDLQAVGIVLLETIFSALAEGGPSQATSADALKRLLLEVFAGDVEQFRRHVHHEIDWLAPAALLDQFGSSGWAMIAALVSGQRTAADLLASNLFLDLRED